MDYNGKAARVSYVNNEREKWKDRIGDLDHMRRALKKKLQEGYQDGIECFKKCVFAGMFENVQDASKTNVSEEFLVFRNRMTYSTND